MTSALCLAGLDVAGRLRQPIIIDIGPSTGRYGSGFEDSEETPPTTSRWTRANAEFDVPLDVDASNVTFSVRAARYLDEPTHISVTGDLTLHGVTKPVAVSLEVGGPIAGREKSRVVGFSGTFNVKRSEWGMTKPIGPDTSSDDVLMMLSFEAIKM